MNSYWKVPLQIPAFVLFRSLGFPKRLPISVTLSLLYACNSRCKTCNIWRKTATNFTLDEYDKTLSSIGKVPYWFTLSGGEPFLRNDIVEICDIIYSNCRPGVITIPTNGSLSNIVPETVDEIARSCPRTQIVVNLSIDGVGEKHDLIRGLKGSFNRSMETYEGLRSLNRPNLTVGIHSVLSTFNASDTSELFAFISRMGPDSYVTEIAEQRAELGTLEESITPSLAEYARVIDDLVSDSEDWRMERLGRLSRPFRRQYYVLAKELLKRKTQVIPCYAGWASAQISPDGDVWPCCIKAEPLGNLRSVGYDFPKIWYSDKAEEARKRIRNKECWCTLANASYTNMLLSPRMFFPILMRFLLHRTTRSLPELLNSFAHSAASVS